MTEITSLEQARSELAKLYAHAGSISLEELNARTRALNALVASFEKTATTNNPDGYDDSEEAQERRDRMHADIKAIEEKIWWANQECEHLKKELLLTIGEYREWNADDQKALRQRISQRRFIAHTKELKSPLAK